MKKVFALMIAFMLICVCAAVAEADAREQSYITALDYFKAQQLDKAYAAFGSLKDYKQANQYREYINVIKLGLDGLYLPAASTIGNLYSTLEQAKEYQIYFSALQLLEDGSYIEAEQLLSDIEEFFDSDAVLERINTLYVQEVYAEAEALMQGGQWDQALEIYTVLEDATMIKECHYRHAEALRAAGDFSAAAQIYASIVGYKDAVEKYRHMTALLEQAIKYELGATVSFGRYTISAEKDAASEKWSYTWAPIEWTVLAVQDGKALLLANEALDSQVYADMGGDDIPEWGSGQDAGGETHESGSDFVTWRTSDLRRWLNSSFLENAFNPSELELIRITNVKAEINPRYLTEAGFDTYDKVFILSLKELETYFARNEQRLCKATDYAVNMRAAGVNDGGYCWYWVRNAGNGDKNAVVVLRDGSISYSGRPVNDRYVAVRPALWISIS